MSKAFKIGYLPENKCYVFQNFGVKNGLIIKSNKQGDLKFNDTSKVINCNELNDCLNELSIGFPKIDKHLLERVNFFPKTINKIYSAFGEKGILVLVFWFGSLFAKQIKKGTFRYPLLELSGNGGLEKNILVDLLYKLTGQKEQEPILVSSFYNEGLWNFASKFSNLPFIVEMSEELETEGFKHFDLKELSPLTSDSSLSENYPFNSTLILIKKQAIALIENPNDFISINLDKKDVNKEEMIKLLKSFTNQDLTLFLLHSLINEHNVLNAVKENFTKVVSDLRSRFQVENNAPRNYGLMIVLLRVFSTMFNVNDDILNNTESFIFKELKKLEKRS